MKTLTDKIGDAGISFKSYITGNAQKHLNRILLGTMLTLFYPTVNSYSSFSIGPYPSDESDDVVEYKSPLLESHDQNSQESKRQYNGRRGEMFTLEDITEKRLRERVTKKINDTNVSDFERIVGRVREYRPAIGRFSEDYNIDDYLVASVIYHESGGNSRAISPKGAMGLMQVMYETVRDVVSGYGDKRKMPTRREIMMPENNIEFGVRYLSSLIDMYNGNVILGLAAYNMGPTRINERLSRINTGPEDAEWSNIKYMLPGETREYVQNVFSKMLMMRMRESYALGADYPVEKPSM
ncbi:lytic transglycosylase domain-containing protein [Candidatus Woesearchaeota archaeon]|nr:lytic transglycosylase domain-containing protein [Candidatus Woesearchaeota archaeon]